MADHLEMISNPPHLHPDVDLVEEAFISLDFIIQHVFQLRILHMKHLAHNVLTSQSQDMPGICFETSTLTPLLLLLSRPFATYFKWLDSNCNRQSDIWPLKSRCKAVSLTQLPLFLLSLQAHTFPSHPPNFLPPHPQPPPSR